MFYHKERSEKNKNCSPIFNSITENCRNLYKSQCLKYSLIQAYHDSPKLLSFAQSKADIAAQSLAGLKIRVSRISSHFMHFSCEKYFIVLSESFKTLHQFNATGWYPPSAFHNPRQSF